MSRHHLQKEVTDAQGKGQKRAPSLSTCTQHLGGLRFPPIPQPQPGVPGRVACAGLQSSNWKGSHHKMLRRGTYRGPGLRGLEWTGSFFVPHPQLTEALGKRGGQGCGEQGKAGQHPYLMLSITGVSRTRNSRCCWGFCGPFFSSPRGEGGGEKGGNRSPGSKTMCSSSCQGQREEGRVRKGCSRRPLSLTTPAKWGHLTGLGPIS